VALYARHPNRLADPVVSLNDGNPGRKIQVRAKSEPAPKL